MGYTHYWRNTQPLTEQFIEAAAKVIESSPVPLAGSYGDEGTSPTATATGIYLNGVGAGAHEPFVFEPHESFSFTKTARKPYDVVVVAMLTLANHFALAEVSSDGDASDWTRGVALARSATGLDLSVPANVRGRS